MLVHANAGDGRRGAAHVRLGEPLEGRDRITRADPSVSPPGPPAERYFRKSRWVTYCSTVAACAIAPFGPARTIVWLPTVQPETHLFMWSCMFDFWFAFRRSPAVPVCRRQPGRQLKREMGWFVVVRCVVDHRTSAAASRGSCVSELC